MQSHSGNGSAGADDRGNGPWGDILSTLDPLGLGRALGRAMVAAAANPEAMTQVATRYVGGITAAAAAASARMLGADTPGPVEPGPKDRRFADPAWTENVGYFTLLQGYLLWTRLVHDLVDAAGLDEPDGEKARFGAEIVVDALAPTNFFGTNPTAQKRAFETGGMSLVRGLRYFLDDLATNGGLPRQVDPSAFTVGKDLAVTPGKVVFRNDLMELIQYAPRRRPSTRPRSCCSPPWINKYYIMDLAPGRSFVRVGGEAWPHRVHDQLPKPRPRRRRAQLDDYALRGPVAALDVIREITGAEQANIVGLCLGGTLTSMLLTYLAEHGDERVRSATLLNTLVDFSSPGRLGALDRRVRHRFPRVADGGARRLPRGVRDDEHVHLHARQRPCLELRRQQLAPR